MTEQIGPWEIFCDRIVASVLRYKLERAFNLGRRVIWCYKGLRREVPREALENAIDLLHDWEQNATKRDNPPAHVGVILWEQTVPLPASEGGSRDPEPADKE